MAGHPRGKVAAGARPEGWGQSPRWGVVLGGRSEPPPHHLRYFYCFGHWERPLLNKKCLLWINRLPCGLWVGKQVTWVFNWMWVWPASGGSLGRSDILIDDNVMVVSTLSTDWWMLTSCGMYWWWKLSLSGRSSVLVLQFRSSTVHAWESRSHCNTMDIVNL